MTTRIENIIFDLDGTLIDSAPSILSGFAFALKSMGITAKTPIESTLIGPPLIETLEVLSGTTSKACLNKLADLFKEYYDTTGYIQSLPYDDVDRVLRIIKKDGVILHLATNKRHIPTLKILDLMDWSNLFSSIYTLDMPSNIFKTKGEMINTQIKDIKINKTHALYVGDRNEDRIAAEENSLSFVWASWGYDTLRPKELGIPNCPTLNSISDLLTLLKKYN